MAQLKHTHLSLVTPPLAKPEPFSPLGISYLKAQKKWAEDCITGNLFFSPSHMLEILREYEKLLIDREHQRLVAADERGRNQMAENTLSEILGRAMVLDGAPQVLKDRLTRIKELADLAIQHLQEPRS